MEKIYHVGIILSPWKDWELLSFLLVGFAHVGQLIYKKYVNEKDFRTSRNPMLQQKSEAKINKMKLIWKKRSIQFHA